MEQDLLEKLGDAEDSSRGGASGEAGLPTVAVDAFVDVVMAIVLGFE